jgi:thiol-disulfide isomerase/thioredoxin
VRVARLIVLLMLPLLPLPAAAAEMKPFVRGSWQEIVKAHAGKPTVLHFWGLTCAPCLVELPHWGALHRARPDMKVVMIGADPAPADTGDLLKTLEKAGLGGLESWAFADPFSERLRYEIDPRWRGEMPYSILLDRNGQATAMSGLADLAAVRAWFDAENRKGSP